MVVVTGIVVVVVCAVARDRSYATVQQAGVVGARTPFVICLDAVPLAGATTNQGIVDLLTIVGIANEIKKPIEGAAYFFGDLNVCHTCPFAVHNGPMPSCDTGKEPKLSHDKSDRLLQCTDPPA